MPPRRHLSRICFILCGIISLPLLARSATYYVDQTGGNDANSGTSTSAPWKNCPGMTAWAGTGALQPGDVIYFDRGDTWLVSGLHGLQLLGGVTYLGNVWGSGTRATLRANADLEAGVVRFRDHPTLPTVIEGFDVDANGKVTSGVNINHTYAGLLNGATKRMKDCEVHNIWSNTLLGQYKYGIVISNHIGTGGYCENVEIINCSVHDTSRDALVLYPGDENANCRIKNILVRGCEVYNTGQDPNYGAGAGIVSKGFVQDAIIEYNYVHGTVGAMIFVNGNETNHYNVGPTNIHIRHNIATGSTIHGGIRIYDGSSGKDPKDIKVYGNLLYNIPAGGLYLSTDLGNTLNLLVYNNTFYNAPVVIDRSSITVTAFEFTNNLLYRTSGAALTDAAGKITAHANNLYFGGSGTLVSSNSVNYSATSLASFEPTALNQDPLFINPAQLPTGFTGSYGIDLAPNQNGLKPQWYSPAINRGSVLNLGYSSSINSTMRLIADWDVGAYEQALVIPPTNARITIALP